MNVNSLSDYVERIFQFQSEYLGSNRSLSKEGIYLDHFKWRKHISEMLSGEDILGIFLPIIYDDTDKNSTTTADCTKKIFNEISEKSTCSLFLE